MSPRKLPPPRDGLAAEVRHLMNVKKGKDLRAFRERHLLPLWRLARSLCHDERAAVDLLVEALDRALERSAVWPRDVALHVWLHQRLIEQWLRGEQRAGTAAASPPAPAAPRRERGRRGGRGPRPKPPSRPREEAGVESGLTFDQDGHLVTSIDDWSEAAGDPGAGDRLADQLARAARQLPPRFSVAWALCDVCGHGPAAAGEILDLSPAAVLSRLHRARLALRRRARPPEPSPAGAAP